MVLNYALVLQKPFHSLLPFATVAYIQKSLELGRHIRILKIKNVALRVTNNLLHENYNQS